MKKIFLLFFPCLLLALSCKSKEDILNDFVSNYNTESNRMLSQIEGNLSATRATLVGPNDLKIDFVVKSSESEIANKMLVSLLPAITKTMLDKSKLLPLINEGLIVKSNLINEQTNELLSSLELNSGNIAEFINDSPGLTSGTGSGNSELQQMLAILNKTLPIEDKANDVTITKIEASGDNFLVYHCKTGDLMNKIYKDTTMAPLFKQEMLRNPQIKSIFSQVTSLGVRGIRYIYTDQKDEELLTINLTAEDI